MQRSTFIPKLEFKKPYFLTTHFHIIKYSLLKIILKTLLKIKQYYRLPNFYESQRLLMEKVFK